MCNVMAPSFEYTGRTIAWINFDFELVLEWIIDFRITTMYDKGVSGRIRDFLAIVRRRAEWEIVN